MFLSELGHKFVDVVGWADFEVVVDNGVTNFMGDDSGKGSSPLLTSPISCATT